MYLQASQISSERLKGHGLILFDAKIISHHSGNTISSSLLYSCIVFFFFFYFQKTLDHMFVYTRLIKYALDFLFVFFIIIYFFF